MRSHECVYLSINLTIQHKKQQIQTGELVRHRTSRISFTARSVAQVCIRICDARRFLRSKYRGAHVLCRVCYMNVFQTNISATRSELRKPGSERAASPCECVCCVCVWFCVAAFSLYAHQHTNHIPHILCDACMCTCRHQRNVCLYVCICFCNIHYLI